MYLVNKSQTMTKKSLFSYMKLAMMFDFNQQIYLWYVTLTRRKYGSQKLGVEARREDSDSSQSYDTIFTKFTVMREIRIAINR